MLSGREERASSRQRRASSLFILIIIMSTSIVDFFSNLLDINHVVAELNCLGELERMH